MTDNEIIKALGWHLNDENNCDECPLLILKNTTTYCVDKLLKSALDLIKRQEAEIENLNVELVGMRGACESYKIHYDNAQAEIERLNIRNKALTAITKNYDWKFAKAKSEAIKEFAERLKATPSAKQYKLFVTKFDIDNLVKEMVGDDNG